MRKKYLFFLFTLFFLFLQVSKATPIFDPESVIPKNGTYIYGKDSDIFSVLIEGTLDNSTARLHARVEDPTSVWKSINMSCPQISTSRWNCTATIPGLEALVKDGNWLLYYFDACDSEICRNLGNSSEPLKVGIDRSPPNITFNNPKNNSYVSGEVEISIEAFDIYSGVDVASVKYSFDNSTWHDMVNTTEKIFISLEKWDTRGYQNNQSFYLYGKASDKLGNSIYKRIQVFVDNEQPSLTVIQPEKDQVIFGTYEFKIQASDRYSGLDFDNITYKVSNSMSQFSCSGTIYESECSVNFDSKWVNDGKHEAIIKVADKAGNSVNQSIPITIDNLPPLIRIISPLQASTVSRNVNISAEIKDEGVGLSNAKFRVESDGSFLEWKDMECVSDFCSAIWNSTEVVDGNYLIRIYAEDLLGRNSTLTSYVSVVNAGVVSKTTTTTTISKTEEKHERKEPGIFAELRSTILNKIKGNPILATAFFLSIALLPIFVFLSTRKTKEKEEINIEEKFEECFAQLEEMRNFIDDSTRITDITQLKDRIRVIIIRLERLEKEPLKKTIDLILSSSKRKLGEDLNAFLKGREEELKIIKTQKEEYIQEISRLLNDSLSEESLENVKRNFEIVNMFIRKLRSLIQREIDILSEGLNEIGYLSKS
jgi:hypothetical protein